MPSMKRMSCAKETKTIDKQKSKIPFYQDVDGFRILGNFSADAFRSALAYKPRPDDLFVVSYPKSGTTWMQHIIGCIYRNGKPFTSAMEFMTQAPFLEMLGTGALNNLKRPGSIKIHLPFHLAPWSSEAKYIFMARNPKDCCVSFYHHTRNFPLYRFEDGDFDDFFELFIEGKVDFGDYFDTLLSWYEHRNDPNVLFLTYEQLKKDTKTYVLKIAEFLGPIYKETLENNDNILKDVIRHSSFNFMKEGINKYFGEIGNIPRELIENNPDIPEGLRFLLMGVDRMVKPGFSELNFIRKGIIGEWKNYFSPSQNARMEKKFRERTAGTDIPLLWKDDM